MSFIDKLKEKLSKENPVETTSASEMYSNDPYSFEVTIYEEDLKTVLRKMASDYNNKKPKKEITISDVFNVIVKKALLEHKLLYEDVKTYSDLVKEEQQLIFTNWRVNYFMNKYLGSLEEKDSLKEDFEAIKKIVNKEE